MNYLLTQELGNEIVSYLVTKPYTEVAPLIEELKKLPVANIIPSQDANTTSVSSVESAPPVSETGENASEEEKG